MLGHFKFYTFFKLVLVVTMFQLLISILKHHNEIQKSDEYVYYGLSEEEVQLPKASLGSWQNVSGIKDYKFLVFSAFLDIRNARTVTVIAVTKTNTRRLTLKKLLCVYWFSNHLEGPANKTAEAKLSIIKEHWGLPYSAYYIKCPLDVEDPVPDAVSIVTSENDVPENLLKIIVNYEEESAWDPSKLSPNVEKMAVCVKPLHYDYNRVMELMEFLELHRIMGADHFFLYNHTVGAQIDCLLQEYQKDGLVTVLPWQLPLVSQQDIRTEGIFASLNDCLYRTMHKYSHSIFVDFDEYIMPTQHETYREFFEYLDSQYGIKQKSSFSFKNAFFYRQWPDDPDLQSLDDPIAQNMIVLRKTTRKTEFHNHRTRSKLILRPELINMVGNHFIWEYFNRNSFANMDVKQEDAFMHHYRVCEFGGDDCVTQKSIIDRTAYRYKEKLVEAVKMQYNRYLSVCKLNEVDNSIEVR